MWEGCVHVGGVCSCGRGVLEGVCSCRRDVLEGVCSCGRVEDQCRHLPDL